MLPRAGAVHEAQSQHEHSTDLALKEPHPREESQVNSSAELRDKHRTLGVAWPVLRVVRQSTESWASDSFPEEAPLERSESSLWSGHEGEGGAIQGWAAQEQAGQELGLLEN